MSRISILGCGWLGLVLGKTLVAGGHTVVGSTTSKDKLAELESAGIHPVLLRIGEDYQELSNSCHPTSPQCHPELDSGSVPKGLFNHTLTTPESKKPNSSAGITKEVATQQILNQVQDDISNDFFNSDWLVISIPFRKRLPDPSTYTHQLQTILQQLPSGTPPNVLFTSSTTVYPNNGQVATEDTPFTPDTDRGQALLQTEQLIRKWPNLNTTIIRFAGLIGPGRDPGRFLAGKTELSGADSPINIIHQNDCVAIMARIITDNITGEIFNAVSDHHPIRCDYYTQKAIELGLPAPRFSDEPRANKIVSNAKIKQKLGYEFTA